MNKKKGISADGQNVSQHCLGLIVWLVYFSHLSQLTHLNGLLCYVSLLDYGGLLDGGLALFKYFGLALKAR